MIQQLLILAAALVVDRMVGDPDWLWRRMPHPVVLFGHGISVLDRRWNRDTDTDATRRHRGMAAIGLLLVLAVLAAVLIQWLFDALGGVGLVLEIGLVSILLAQKSLAEHVGAVANALRDRGLDGGRGAVSRIVGRDPESLDTAGVCRAAIESLAENYSDGVVAPAFWFALFGLPGLFAYKMLNTADSMIGHRDEHYRAFGWASARLDDAANWPAARLSAVLIAASAMITRGPAEAARSMGCALRDAGLHRSPNAGWPEASMAGALDISLAGERRYGGVVVHEPRLNAAGRSRLDRQDIVDAIAVFHMACWLLVLIVFFLMSLALIAG